MPAEDKTYLELSEEGDGSHKFYEVTVKGKELTIRYGRIGDQGQTSASKFPTPEKARAEAEKKIQEKMRKGYERAVMGQRQRRAVTRRPTESRPSKAKQAPVLWKFKSGSAAFGIFIGAERCWVGNEKGQVYALDHEGQVLFQAKLPDGVKCLVADDIWVYAGCDDGNVYDLTRKVPRLAYQIAEDVNILWLDIHDGILAVSDEEGRVTTIDPEDQSLWTKKSKGDTGWMVRCDRAAVYHGHADGVTSYALGDGKLLWNNKQPADVLFGWQTEGAVYASTADDKVFCLDKKRGKVTGVCKCDDSVMSCASSPDGRYVFAGDCSSSVYCFDAKGTRLWKVGTGCESALSMQYHNERIYIVTCNGALACIDASEAAITAAQEGKVPKAREVKAPKAEKVSTELETTREVGEGVVVECVEKGGRLRVHVVSKGYKKDWNVQFPKDIREAGARYVVEGVRESARGGFYRAFGEIKKLEPEAAAAGGTGRKRR
jgi:outer membrane protein assembly factor BamB/predicted DNA-binding WGR domain protein